MLLTSRIGNIPSLHGFTAGEEVPRSVGRHHATAHTSATIAHATMPPREAMVYGIPPARPPCRYFRACRLLPTPLTIAVPPPLERRYAHASRDAFYSCG